MMSIRCKRPLDLLKKIDMVSALICIRFVRAPYLADQIKLTVSVEVSHDC